MIPAVKTKPRNTYVQTKSRNRCRKLKRMLAFHSFTEISYKLACIYCNVRMLAFHSLQKSLINLLIYTAMYECMLSTLLPQSFIHLNILKCTTSCLRLLFTNIYYTLIFYIVAFDLLPTSLINLRVSTAMYNWLISTRLPTSLY